MSHVVDIQVKITDLQALMKACSALGTLEFVEGQKRYKWYGTHVGDYPMPEGFTKKDLGKCDHAIRVKGATKSTYEIGVVKRKDGQGYTFLFDFYAGGFGLYKALTGQDWSYKSDGDPAAHLNRLYQEYAVEVAEQSESVQELIQQGWTVTRERQPDESIHLVATR